MRHTLIATVASIALMGATANAAEYTFKVIEPIPPTAELLAALDTLCNTGDYVLSARALEACQSGNMPRIAGDGERFVGSGIGGEFNTLLRQMTAKRVDAAQ